MLGLFTKVFTFGQLQQKMAKVKMLIVHLLHHLKYRIYTIDDTSCKHTFDIYERTAHYISFKEIVIHYF